MNRKLKALGPASVAVLAMSALRRNALHTRVNS
jgi:hypothetical protein